MKSEKGNKTYIAFLRGINVGGHHKVPMTDLRKELEKMGFQKIITILNSGNVIFAVEEQSTTHLENLISVNLENHFSFPIPVIIRNSESISRLYNDHPFKDIDLNKDIRLYISFLKEGSKSNLKLPWSSSDNSFKILVNIDKNILSVLNLSLWKTTKSMEIMEKEFGKNITTRNWNTIERIVKKL